jgi:hypothetical protein
MDEGLLHLPIQMIEWLISGARIAGMNVWRWAFLPGPAFSRGIEFQERPSWRGKPTLHGFIRLLGILTQCAE